MTDSHAGNRTSAIVRAISLVEAALRVCDEQNLIFPAIDLSLALDKLYVARDVEASE